MKTRRLQLWTEAERVSIDLPGVRVLSAGAGHTDLELTTGLTSVGAVVDVVVRQTTLHDMTIEETPLDEVIRDLYGSANRERPS
jgi:hypothetical protein